MSGNAVKLIEDQDYREILEESYKQNLAAEAGLAPTVHAVYRKKDQVVVVMDKIDTDTWYHADAGDDVTPTLLGELDNYDMEIGLKLYAQLLKAGVLHADFHTGNWFMNDDGEAIAIDFGTWLASFMRHLKSTSNAPFNSCFPALQILGYEALGR